MKSLSRVRLLANSWTAAYQAPLYMGFTRQKYWSGVPLPSPDSNSYWSQIEFFQFAFVEEAFLEKVPNSSPAGTPTPGARWRVPPVTLTALSQGFSTHLAAPPGRAHYPGLLTPLHPHRRETGRSGRRGTEGAQAPLYDKAF